MVGTESNTYINDIILNDHMYYKVDTDDIHYGVMETSVGAFELVEDSCTIVPTTTDCTSVCSISPETDEILNYSKNENNDEFLDLANLDLLDFTETIQQLIEPAVLTVDTAQPMPDLFTADQASFIEDHSRQCDNEGQSSPLTEVEQYFAPSPSSGVGSMSPASAYHDYMSPSSKCERDSNSPFADHISDSICDDSEDFGCLWLENFTLFPSLV